MRQRKNLSGIGGARSAGAGRGPRRAYYQGNIPMQPSGVAGSRAQRATLRQSSSPQTRQQVKASQTLRTTLAQVARRSFVWTNWGSVLLFIWAIRNYHFCNARCSLA